MSRVLDIPDPQVLLHFPQDPDGFYFHRRVLLTRAGGGGTWVTLTPDLELAVHDLTQVRHRVVARAEKLAPDVAEQCYIFDPISRSEMEEHRRRARIQARILADGGDPAEALNTRWLLAGPAPDRIGEAVHHDLVGDDSSFRDLGNLAMVEIDGDIFWCEKVAEADEAEWVRARRGATKDDRLLGLHFRGGRRFLPLREALGSFSQQEYDDWPFQGPRLLREYLEAVDEAGGFIAFEESWVRRSGVAEGSAQAHEHRTGSETLRLLVEFDQLDATNLAAVENLCRRQVQLELAVERSPAHPDFVGLSEIMGGPITEGGAAAASRFREWVGSKQRERASVLKQARLEREEREAISCRGRDSHAREKGGGRGTERPKAKAKGGRGGGSSSAAETQ